MEIPLDLENMIIDYKNEFSKYKVKKIISILKRINKEKHYLDINMIFNPLNNNFSVLYGSKINYENIEDFLLFVINNYEYDFFVMCKLEKIKLKRIITMYRRKPFPENTMDFIYIAPYIFFKESYNFKINNY